MSEEKSRKKDDRTRNWNFILYPDSAPENWRNMISETHIEWLESPLHDVDINPDGTQKKPHYHVTLLFPTNKSYEQVKKITDSVNATIPVRCQSVKGSIRYMVHKDNPEKTQYDWDKIKCYGGADLNVLCAPTATERQQIQEEIMTYIRKSGIIEFADIVSYAMDNGLKDWFNVLMNYSTMSIVAFLRSQRHKVEMAGQATENKTIKVNIETGEVTE